MSVVFSCPECEKQLRVKDELAGKKIKCPDCAAVLLVPEESGPPANSRIKAGRGAEERTAVRKPAVKTPKARDDEDEDDAESPVRKPPAKGRKSVRKAESKRGLVIGLSVGGGVLVVLAVVLTIVFWPKKTDTNKDAVATARPPKDDPVPVVVPPGKDRKQPDPVVPVGTGQAKTEVFQKLLKSTAWVVMSNCVGSGALIDRDEQLVVTNYHVVAKETSAIIFFPAFDAKTKELITTPEWYMKEENRRRVAVSGKTVYKDSKRDLALIKLAHIPPGVPTVPLRAGSSKVAENVHSIGSSGVFDGALWRYTYGAVRQVYEKRMQYEDQLVHCWMIETNAPTNKGDSGGPIVNDRGQLVALVQGGVQADPDDQQRLVSYNVDVREIHFVLGEYYKSVGKTYDPPRLSDVDPGDLLALAKKLEDPDAGVRLQAVKAIGEFGAEARALVPTLVKAWKDDNPAVRLRIAGALEQIGPPTTADAPLLLDLAGSTAAEPKRYAAAMLAVPNLVKKEQALPVLINLSRDADVETRSKAVAGIGTLGADDRTPSAVALADRLADEDASIRAAAATLLGRLGGTARAVVLPKLLGVLGDADATAAQAAAGAIRQLGDPTDADLPLLLRTLQSKTANERAVAMELLAKFGPKAKDALPQVQQNLKDGDMRVRLAAVALAGALGKEAKGLVPVLGEMLGEAVKAEDAGDAGPKEGVGDARMRELLLRSSCMVMWGDGQVIKAPESAFVVHVGERLVLSPYGNVKDTKNVVVFFPVKRGGNLITQAREYVSNVNAIGIPGVVVASNPKANLAVIKLTRLPAGTEALPLAAKAPDKGVRVAALTADGVEPGTWVGNLWQLHSSKVLDVRPFKSARVEGFFVLLDGVLSEYDSGYPMMDEQGNVVAVGLDSPRVDGPDGKVARRTIGVDVREIRPLLDEYFKQIGGNFRESATRASLGNVTQNTFRVAIAKALAHLGPDAAEAVKPLQAALKDTSAGVRAQAAQALGALGKPAVEAIPEMLQASILEDNPEVIETGIAKLGKDAVAPLVKALGNTNLKIKTAALRTLGRIGPAAKDGALAPLTAYARGANPDLAQVAAEALKQINR